jgi:hypothetical protein
MLCGPLPDGTAIVPDWLTPPQHAECIQSKYRDNFGEPYQESEIKPKDPEDLRKLKEEHKYRLRTEK